MTTVAPVIDHETELLLRSGFADDVYDVDDDHSIVLLGRSVVGIRWLEHSEHSDFVIVQARAYSDPEVAEAIFASFKVDEDA